MRAPARRREAPAWRLAVLVVVAGWALLHGDSLGGWLAPRGNAFGTAEAAVVVGCAGKAARFQQQRADLVSLQWFDVPTEIVTVEHWVRIMDPYLSNMLTLGYSVFDPETSYEAANEFQLAFSKGFTRVWRATSSTDCNATACDVYGDGEWTHVALRWRADTGRVSITINGDVAYDEVQTGDFRKPIVPSGVLHFGQEADTPYGDFDELQSFDGAVDEFRVWRTWRTDAELAEWMPASVPPSHMAGLALYWAFDAMEYELSSAGTPSMVVPDMSGNGNHGFMGRLVGLTNQLTYSTLRTPTVPTSPVIVVSTAGVAGSGHREFEVEPRAGALTNVSLPALSTADPDAPLTLTITSLPKRGHLEQTADSGLAGTPIMSVPTVVSPNSTRAGNVQVHFVVYVGGDDEGSLDRDTWADNFTYSASDASGDVAESSVSLFSAGRRPGPATHLAVETAEDTPVYIKLVETSQRGDALDIVILTLPSRGGGLYIAGFVNGTIPSYLNLEKDVSKLQRITEPGSRVEGVAVPVVVYAPPPFESGQQLEYFTYASEDPSSGVRSDPANVTLSVTPVNNAPVARLQPHAVSSSSTDTVITLAADDVDGGFSEHRTYRIKSFPHLGELFQYQEQVDPDSGEVTSVRGQPVPSTASVPTVIQWAQRVLSASSQFSLCSETCYVFDQCDEAACSDTAWHASQILGVPDVFPRYGDIKQGWDLSSENAGHEWIELEFALPLHLSQVDVYETFKPGAVWRISGAVEYDGAATDWRTLWQGGVQLGLDEQARIFSPSLCTFAASQFRYLRLDLDTAAVPGWNNYDSISMFGSQAPPPGTLSDPMGRVVYVAPPFVHTSDGVPFDTFTYTVDDCDAESAEATQVLEQFEHDGHRITLHFNGALLLEQSPMVRPGELAAISIDVASVAQLLLDDPQYAHLTADDVVLTLVNVTREVSSVVPVNQMTMAEDLATVFAVTSLAGGGGSDTPLASRIGDTAVNLPLRLPVRQIAVRPTLATPRLRLTMDAQLGDHSVMTALVTAVACPAGFFSRDDDGMCEACAESVKTHDVLVMDELRAFRFREACRAALVCPAGTRREPLEANGGVVVYSADECVQCEPGSVRSSSDAQDDECFVCQEGTVPAPSQSACVQLVENVTEDILIGAFAAIGAFLTLWGLYTWNRHRLQEQRENEMRVRVAEEKNAAKKAFLRYIFHELRVPFTSVALGLESLRSEYRNKLPGRANEYVEMMTDASNAVSHLLDDVLSIQKIEDGAFELDSAPFNLRRVIRLLHRTMRALAAHHDVVVDAIVGDDIPDTLIGDQHRLRQVMANMVGNAVKFSPPGSTVTLRAFVVNADGTGEPPAHLASVSSKSPGEVPPGISETKAVPAPSPSTSTAVAVHVEPVPHHARGSVDGGRDGSNGSGGRAGEAARAWDGGGLASTGDGTDGADKLSNPSGHTIASSARSAASKHPPGSKCTIKVTVTDHGPGISPEDQTRLFKPYMQVNAGALQKAGGTGLGLSISKAIVEKHAGRIGVENTAIGKGSTFYVTIPFTVADPRLAQARGTSSFGHSHSGHHPGPRTHRQFSGGAMSSASPKPGDGGTRSGGDAHSSIDASAETLLSPTGGGSMHHDADDLRWPINVLVVDDVGAIRKLVCRFLERYGMHTHSVGDGHEAIEFVTDTQEPIDLIIMDYQMPHLNGPDAVRQLRSAGYTMRIFGFTGNALREDQETFLAAGVDAVLTKPMKSQALEDLLARYFTPAQVDSTVDSPATKTRDDGAGIVPAMTLGGGGTASLSPRLRSGDATSHSHSDVSGGGGEAEATKTSPRPGRSEFSGALPGEVAADGDGVSPPNHHREMAKRGELPAITLRGSDPR